MRRRCCHSCPRRPFRDPRRMMTTRRRTTTTAMTPRQERRRYRRGQYVSCLWMSQCQYPSWWRRRWDDFPKDPSPSLSLSLTVSVAESFLSLSMLASFLLARVYLPLAAPFLPRPFLPFLALKLSLSLSLSLS